MELDDFAQSGDRLTLLMQLVNEATSAYDEALAALRREEHARQVLAALRSRLLATVDALNASVLSYTRSRPLVVEARVARAEHFVAVSSGMGAKGALMALRSMELTLGRIYRAASPDVPDAGVRALMEEQAEEVDRRAEALDALLAEAPFRSPEIPYAKPSVRAGGIDRRYS
jgi:hypothetical protein